MMASAFSRAEAAFALSEAQRRVVDAPPASAIVVTGPAGSGKTTALAARTSALAVDGERVVVCSHAAACRAFASALDRLGDRDPRIRIDTLDGHLARFMRDRFAASSASPSLRVGSDADSVALLRAASSDVLDMSWPGFSEDGFSLDLPLIVRTDAFFEAAAALFRQLRQSRVDREAFDEGCASGIAAFYGDDVERALVHCADPEAARRASRRGRLSLRATTDALRGQKRAERDLIRLLSHMYGAYRAAARGAEVLCAADLIDEALGWLRRDEAALREVARSIGALVVDDAEDAEPGAADLLSLLREAGVADIALARCKASTVDGIAGRREAVLPDVALHVELAPLPCNAAPVAARYADEGVEADAIARSIMDLIAAGVSPGDIVVATRDVDAAAVYAAALESRGVPAVAPAARWQAPHDIADLLALFAVVADPYDHAHLLRVLASPLVGLSDASLRALCSDPAGSAQLSLDVTDDRERAGARGEAEATLADNALSGFADRLLSAPGRLALAAFRERWAVWRSACADLRAGGALAYLIEASGFAARWRADRPYRRERLADDGARLIEAALAIEGAASAAAGTMVSALEKGFAVVRPARSPDDAVACRTIVDVKGCRSPYVFVAGVAHERFPRVYVSRPLAFSKRYGIIARENVAGAAPYAAKFAWYYAKFGAKARYLEEERRALAYGLSRASVGAWATGFAKPPRWAADGDLLSDHGV